MVRCKTQTSNVQLLSQPWTETKMRVQGVHTAERRLSCKGDANSPMLTTVTVHSWQNAESPPPQMSSYRTRAITAPSPRGLAHPTSSSCSSALRTMMLPTTEHTKPFKETASRRGRLGSPMLTTTNETRTNVSVRSWCQQNARMGGIITLTNKEVRYYYTWCRKSCEKFMPFMVHVARACTCASIQLYYS
jgi:hypothetical protein